MREAVVWHVCRPAENTPYHVDGNNEPDGLSAWVPLTDNPECELVILAGKNDWVFSIPSERGIIVHFDASSMEHGAGRGGKVGPKTVMTGNRLVAAAYPTKAHGRWLEFCDPALRAAGQRRNSGSAAERLVVASPWQGDGSPRTGAPEWGGRNQHAATRSARSSAEQ